VTRVSVIIPVRDRRELLAAALEALEAQTLRDFEVIVVDDGSTDGSRELASASLVAGRPVRVFDNPGRGAIAARQFGWEQSRSDLLAFTDSDCEPAPGWLAALTAVADAGADVVAGVTLPARRPKPLERTMVSTTDSGGYPTCNVLYRRSWVERVGGFATDADRTLTFDGGSLARNYGFWEDTLMGWRLRRAGAVPGFAPDAVVHHHVFAPDLGDLLRRTWMLGSQPSLMKLVPELRATLLNRRVFYQERGRAMVYVMVIGVALRRRGLAVGALGVWAAARLRRHLAEGTGIGESIAALPVELVVDGILTAALVRGSLAARTVVL